MGRAEKPQTQDEIGSLSGAIPTNPDPECTLSILVRVDEAASITGLPASLIRKSFIDERKRPPNIPPPPPHKRVGRSVYIIRQSLAEWVSNLA